MVKVYLTQTIKTLLHEELVKKCIGLGLAARTTKDELPCRERKSTAENPPKNVEVIAGAVGGKLPVIKPIKWLSFKPTKVVKSFDNAEYSDKIYTDDEIQATLCDIDASNDEVLYQCRKTRC